jgi:hypothetical protein
MIKSSDETRNRRNVTQHNKGYFIHNKSYIHLLRGEQKKIEARYDN